MLHEADRVVATHDIHGMFKGAIRQGTAGVIIGHCEHDIPTYRVEFTPDGDPAAVLTMSGLTEMDVQPD